MQAPRLPPTTCHLEGRLARAARRQHKLRRLVADNSLAAAPDDAATSARTPGIEFPKNCGRYEHQRVSAQEIGEQMSEPG